MYIGHACHYAGGGQNATCRSQFSFHHVVLRMELKSTQAIRLGSKCLSLLSHLASPLLLLHIIKLEVGSYLQRCDYTTFSLLSSQFQDSMAYEGSRQMCSHTHDHPMSCQSSLLKPLPQ